jgi:hypothetical protein
MLISWFSRRALAPNPNLVKQTSLTGIAPGHISLERDSQGFFVPVHPLPLASERQRIISLLMARRRTSCRHRQTNQPTEKEAFRFVYTINVRNSVAIIPTLSNMMLLSARSLLFSYQRKIWRRAMCPPHMGKARGWVDELFPVAFKKPGFPRFASSIHTNQQTSLSLKHPAPASCEKVTPSLRLLNTFVALKSSIGFITTRYSPSLLEPHKRQHEGRFHSIGLGHRSLCQRYCCARQSIGSCIHND